MEPRFGNPTPRIAECEAGLINSIGLQNPGVEKVIEEELPHLATIFDKKVMANIGGFSVEEYAQVAQRLDRCDQIGWIEVNISCPNVRHGGIAFGTDPDAAASVIRAVKDAVRKPVIAKLSPNVTDITKMAIACENAGADGISLVNTLLGMRIDLKTKKPVIANKMGGFSGPAIFPAALRMVYQVYDAAVSYTHLNAVGEELGMKVEFKPIDWDAKEIELKSGTIDCVWNGMSVTPERKESMALTDKYLNNKIVLMTLKTSSIDVTDASQLANLKIGTQADSAALEMLKSNEAYDSFKDNIMEYDTYDTAIMDLKLSLIHI